MGGRGAGKTRTGAEWVKILALGSLVMFSAAAGLGAWAVKLLNLVAGAQP